MSRKLMSIVLAIAFALPLAFTANAAGESELTVNARDLLQAFKRDATAARKKYYNKVITVTGILDSVGRATGGEVLNMEMATVARVTRKNAELERIKIALEEEDDRMEEARKWAREFDRDRRKRILRTYDGDNNQHHRNRDRDAYREYSDSKNPHGPKDENLIVDVSATGLCRGVRSGKVFIDKCADLTFTTRQGNRLKELQDKK